MGKLLSTILTFAVMIWLTGYLLRIGTLYLQEALPVLAIVFLIAGIAYAVWQIWKHRNDTRW